MSFREITYTDGFAEIMVHQDTKSGKYLRVYIYTRDLPDVSWLWDKEEWKEIGRRAFTFKTESSINACFTNFLIKSSRSIERLITELEAAGFVNTEDKES